MNDKNDNTTSVCEKIKLSISFSVSVLWYCINFFYNDNNNYKKDEWWKNKIHRVRKEYDRNNFEVIAYSFFSALFVSIILCIIVIIISMVSRYGLKLSCWNLNWGGNTNIFLSILLAVWALFVSIIISIVLKKKEVESGREFYEQLYSHINYLKYVPIAEKERELYIISPNINIGIEKINIGSRKEFKMETIISENKKINFKFICKSIDIEYLKKYGTEGYKDETNKRQFFNEADQHNSEMLKYLYDRYHYKNAKVDKLNDVVSELEKIMSYSNFEPIQRYDEIFKDSVANEKKVAGYLSTKECLLGRYIDKIEKNEEDVFFRGETATSFEFIDIVKTYMIEVEKRIIKNGDQFMEYLDKHIIDLNNNIPLKKGKKHVLYIISPNVTVGRGKKDKILTTIKNATNVQFKFICKTFEEDTLDNYIKINWEDKNIEKQNSDFLRKIDKTKNSMLIYLYEGYCNGHWKRLKQSIDVSKQIIEIEKETDSNVKIIQDYDKIYEDKNVGGYLSDEECVLGIYEKISEKTGEIPFRGEIITSSEFISIIKTGMIEKKK